MSFSGSTLRVEIQLPLERFELQCNFQTEREVVVLFGPSGSGKTSVLECIAGFRSPLGGRISLGDRILYSSESGIDIPVRQRRVGYLAQNPALFPHLSVRQNVEYGLLDRPRQERATRVDSILQRLQIAQLSESRPASISGGEQQRVALARTLVCDPELLLLDEPLSALDLRLKSLLLDALFEWQRERSVPMLYVTHEQAEAYSLSRRVLVMESGKVVADGEPRQVFTAPISRESAALSGYENLFDAVIEETHPELGTMTCRVAGTDLLLESPLSNKALGEQACLAVRAGDILVATARPSGISARNVLYGRVRVIEDCAGMVELRVPSGSEDHRRVEFCVHITRGALQSLGLKTDQDVWLIIKTHSIQFLRS